MTVPKLSVCMIVKDEASRLPGALASIREELPDAEIVIVIDSRTSDETGAIACACPGAIVCTRTWSDDFASARNASIDLATGAWVLVFDADHRFAPGSGDRIRKTLEQHGDEPLLVQIDTMEANGASAAVIDVASGAARDKTWCPIVLFPRVIGGEVVRYERRVHEHNVRWAVARGARMARLEGAAIVHYGGVRATRDAEGRDARNERLLRMCVEENPDDIESCAYLARDYAVAERWAECEGVGDYATSRPYKQENRAHLFFILRHYADALAHREDFRGAYEAARLAFTIMEPK